MKAGQFLNIRTGDGFVPLLRRPFSVYRRDGERLEIIFNVVGLGTKILATGSVGNPVDVIGPLGNAFGVKGGYEEALLVAGGLGVAPMPVLTAELKKEGKPVRTFLGARNGSQIVRQHLDQVSVATDDGSAGHHGTVVDLLRNWLSGSVGRSGGKYSPAARRRCCGRSPRWPRNSPSIASSRSRARWPAGSESARAARWRLRNGPKKYALVCRDGTVFNSNEVVL